ncbi:Fc.00g087420.m01.CDS01 [Cosmosporella sp. VM-42]
MSSDSQTTTSDLLVSTTIESSSGPLPSTSTYESTSTGNHNGGYGPNTTLTVLPTTPCITPSRDEPVTEYSIVYTATVTWFGNISDYSPPYNPIVTPNYCPQPSITSSSAASSVRSTFLQFSTFKETPTPCATSTCEESSAPEYGGPWPGPTPVTSHKGKGPSHILSSMPSTRVTVTFITTDKNPSVVYPSDTAPSFDQPGKGGGPPTPIEHNSVPPNQQRTRHKGHNDDPQSANLAPPLTFSVTARGGEVTINDQTFTDLKPGQTTTITVGEGTFTIFPTAIEGEGATVKKPEPVGTAVSVISPSSSTLGGLSVVVSGSEAIIDGTSFNIPPAGTTTKVKEEPVSIGPGKITVDSETLTFQASGGARTDVIVTGGEMVTAVGKSVYIFHTTTLTYGPGIPEATEVVDDDTITIGPSGVVVHGTTLGGTSANATATSYEIVGGATITKLSPSFVIIDGTTFTVGPDATSTTKEIGGETITIGPNGIVVSSVTMSYPFGSSTVTTIKASATATENLPLQTDDSEDDLDDNAGTLVQPSLVAGFTGLCIAIGVWILI